MNKSVLALTSLLTVAIGCNANASEFGKPIVSTIPVTTHNIAQDQQHKTKQVYLMNIPLTAKQKNQIVKFQPNKIASATFANNTLPKQIQLGMNNTPVLDQGRHGTCVTFAMTAAVDALLGKGDYVSQLCSLELGSYIEKRSYTPSGWEGSWGNLVLNQILQYGIVNKQTQQQKSCSGMTEYPRDQESNVGNPMTLDDFKLNSENLNENIFSITLLSVPQRLLWNLAEAQSNMDSVIQNVKKELAAKTENASVRVVFGTLLPYQHGTAGACAKFHETNDTWALTAEIKADTNPELGGHEMVITGYDDDATAVDKDSVKHTGLFTLRNSWGADAGDEGNYYMTYDYFKQFAIEARKVELVKSDLK